MGMTSLPEDSNTTAIDVINSSHGLGSGSSVINPFHRQGSAREGGYPSTLGTNSSFRTANNGSHSSESNGSFSGLLTWHTKWGADLERFYDQEFCDGVTSFFKGGDEKSVNFQPTSSTL